MPPPTYAADFTAPYDPTDAPRNAIHAFLEETGRAYGRLVVSTTVAEDADRQYAHLLAATLNLDPEQVWTIFQETAAAGSTQDSDLAGAPPTGLMPPARERLFAYDDAALKIRGAAIAALALMGEVMYRLASVSTRQDWDAITSLMTQARDCLKVIDSSILVARYPTTPGQAKE